LGVSFLGAKVGTDTKVYGFAVLGFIMGVDEMDGVGTGGYVRLDSLGESSYFVGGGVNPCF
jgi:hypothetical protein